MQNILYGYEEEFNLLSSIYNNGKLPNKILFSGKKGIGKSLTANHFVNYILSKILNRNQILIKIWSKDQ